MLPRPPFHLAFPVDDLDAARGFYVGVLGAREGRSSRRWVDFDLYGHQIVAQLVEKPVEVATNEVDGEAVPAFHFGVVLTPEAWAALADRLREAGVSFLIDPHTRHRGRAGEQSTFFVLDPAGNALEFKAFADPEQLFAVDEC